MFRITSKRILNRTRRNEAIALVSSSTLVLGTTLYYLSNIRSTSTLQTQSDKSSYASQSQLHNGKIGIINPTVFL